MAEWEAQHHQSVRLVLATSKDITDAILADPELSKQVPVIDMRYWQYRPDSTLWAPKGGQNLAFREIVGKDFRLSGDGAPPTTPQQAYRQVREYRERFPDKAVVAWHNGVGQLPAFMAGAAQVLTQNPTAGHGQGRIVDHTAFDLRADAPGHRAAPNAARARAAARGRGGLGPGHARPRSGAAVFAGRPDAHPGAAAAPSPGCRLVVQPRHGADYRPGLAPKWRKGTILAKPTAESWVLLLKR